jgi:hypothetical protein
VKRLQRWILYDAPVPLPKFGTRRRALVNRFLRWVEGWGENPRRYA